MLTAVQAVDWPQELANVANVLEQDLVGLVAALESGDLEGAREGFAAVHNSQHDFSKGVYEWLTTGSISEGHGH